MASWINVFYFFFIAWQHQKIEMTEKNGRESNKVIDGEIEFKFG